MSVPIATSPGRSGFGPAALSLSYDSGSGETAPFGFGWKPVRSCRYSKDGQRAARSIGTPTSLTCTFSRVRKTWFRFSIRMARAFKDDARRPRVHNPSLPPPVSRDSSLASSAGPTSRRGEIHWRSISRDNITTLYGKDNNSRIFDPNRPGPGSSDTHLSVGSSARSYDDKGNAHHLSVPKRGFATNFRGSARAKVISLAQ